MRLESISGGAKLLTVGTIVATGGNMSGLDMVLARSLIL
jgi:hypothetical protein